MERWFLGDYIFVYCTVHCLQKLWDPVPYPAAAKPGPCGAKCRNGCPSRLCLCIPRLEWFLLNILNPFCKSATWANGSPFFSCPPPPAAIWRGKNSTSWDVERSLYCYGQTAHAGAASGWVTVRTAHARHRRGFWLNMYTQKYGVFCGNVSREFLP